MSATDSSTHPEDRERDRDRDRGDRDRDTERGERGDRSRQKPSASSASKSSKDLSHVPCKFYKVGGCTAGSSCPFSHTLAEPGGQKETCAWFVKGNCKFGHKCALAHILPGQSMAMDRKNKKAAQLAAAAANGSGERGERFERGGKDGKGGRGANTKRDANAGNRNALLTGGSTAPTRIALSTPTGRPPITMPLKASLSPSAPAPPLASFGVLDDLEGAGAQLATAPAQGKQSSQDSTTTATAADNTPTQETEPSKPESNASPTPLPPSAPRPTTTTKPQQDFGPIGSPPTKNGTFSPGTSPQRINIASGSPGVTNNMNGFLSSSPFSAPGTQSVFLSGGGSYNGGGGMAASLGSGLTMMGGRRGWGGESGSVGAGAGGFSGVAPTSMQQRMNREYDISLEYEEYGARSTRRPTAGRGDVAVEDGDLEDFLPSSLTDLLTPEERSRRMSRSNSGQPPVTPLAAPGARLDATDAGDGAAGMGHRYSRSVPAPSLLGDIKSIWSDNNAHPLPSSPPAHRVTPSSSFTARFDPGLMSHNSGGDEMLSMSMGSAGSGMMSLSPSNASAAFLPGLHSHYLTSKAKQAQAQQLGLGGLGRGVRGTSGPLGSTLNNYLLGGGSTLSSNSNNHLHAHNNAHINSQHTYRATPSPFDLTQHQHQHLNPHPHTARPIPSNPANAIPNNADDPHQGTHLLSPSSRALQSHAPGQSLPQGLAAGYSRIHALPPPPNLASPNSASGFGNGTPPGLGLDPNATAGIPSSGPYGQWKGAMAASPPINTSGLDSMFSRLSYSAAAAPRTASNGSNPTPAGGATISPPGLTRNVSSGRYPQQTGPLSPLSGPVVSRDVDGDDLFDMDG
ncbi:hypothetical protein Hypma_005727 [Hypsizygus marmoreus]|uniref:C3H1-type domain-containing protein n=1 Tax=Hypsizygus marmoreus TaxID=39966 RepID=A0A369KD64_HYPMA|nr:hypothetical protein Hypma_005727 [Hypsizygus marmoreus]